jgi:hypothetical protein
LVESRLRRFLQQGHRAFWIVGVDLGGTGRQALQFLYDLKLQFSDQMDLRVFTLGDNAYVFHPKVFWFDAPTQKRAVIVGSSNATQGGLRDNVEVSVEFGLTDVEDEELVGQFEDLWITYSTPLPPFSQGNLTTVDQAFIDRLPDDDPPDNRPGYPHLVGRRPTRGTRRRRRTRRRRSGRELIQDVLQETRETQVQLPVDALRSFFADNRSVRLRYVRDREIVKEDDRPLIHLPNNTHRIEIDAIRGLPRPQIIRFTRPAAGRGPVDYELILRGTSQYQAADRLLDARGEQTRSGSRRWLLH